MSGGNRHTVFSSLISVLLTLILVGGVLRAQDASTELFGVRSSMRKASRSQRRMLLPFASIPVSVFTGRLVRTGASNSICCPPGSTPPGRRRKGCCRKTLRRFGWKSVGPRNWRSNWRWRREGNAHCVGCSGTGRDSAERGFRVAGRAGDREFAAPRPAVYRFVVAGAGCHAGSSRADLEFEWRPRFWGIRGYQSSYLVDGADNNNGFFAQARGRYRAPYQFSMKS